MKFNSTIIALFSASSATRLEPMATTGLSESSCATETDAECWGFPRCYQKRPTIDCSELTKGGSCCFAETEEAENYYA